MAEQWPETIEVRVCPRCGRVGAISDRYLQLGANHYGPDGPCEGKPGTVRYVLAAMRSGAPRPSTDYSLPPGRGFTDEQADLLLGAARCLQRVATFLALNMTRMPKDDPVLAKNYADVFNDVSAHTPEAGDSVGEWLAMAAVEPATIGAPKQGQDGAPRLDSEEASMALGWMPKDDGLHTPLLLRTREKLRQMRDGA